MNRYTSHKYSKYSSARTIVLRRLAIHITSQSIARILQKNSGKPQRNHAATETYCQELRLYTVEPAHRRQQFPANSVDYFHDRSARFASGKQFIESDAHWALDWKLKRCSLSVRQVNQNFKSSGLTSIPDELRVYSHASTAGHDQKYEFRLDVVGPHEASAKRIHVRSWITHARNVAA
jgi:uncharacterized protein YprB with RNaseH-like and TPR domain